MPVSDTFGGKELKLSLVVVQSKEALFQGCTDSCGAGRHQTLHKDHQEADVPLLRCHGLVIAVANILSDRFVQPLLCFVPVKPGDSLNAGHSWLEQRLAFSIDRKPLLCPHDERAHAVARDAVLIGERVSIQQLHQTVELIRFPLVRRCRQKQKVRGSFGKCRAQLVPRNLIRAASHSVSLVDDHKVPVGRNQIFEPFTIVGAELLRAPSAPPFERFHRIQRTDRLIVQPPEVLLVIPKLPVSGEL